MALGQAAVAGALLIVFTQVADFVAAKWTTVQWSGDAGFATTHFTNTISLICFRQWRRVGPERWLPMVAEDKREPHGQDPLRAIECLGPISQRIQTGAERGS